MTTALYPGSFDPFHLGHLGAVEQAVRQFESVVVGVLGNPAKSSGLLTVAERVAAVEAATAQLPNARVVSWAGLAVDLARRVGATVIVRSAHKEHAHERAMAAMNEQFAGIPTVFVMVDVSTRAISSSAIRALIAAGEHDRAQQLVPAGVAELLARCGRST